MKNSEILREARNVLFERGWHQGDLVNFATDSVCAVGAIHVAITQRPHVGFAVFMGPERAGATNTLAAVIHTGDIGEWNDAPGRTFDEVVDAFDRAEKIAEAQEA